jgi:hypothetical protein
MQQPWRSQRRVTLIPHLDKILLFDTILHMYIELLMFLDSHERRSNIPVLGGIVMSRPDLDVRLQSQQSASRVEEIIRTTAREVAASCANVCVEEGVAAEYIV